MADKNPKQNPNRLRFAYIVEQFETIQKKHQYIKSFHMGPDEEIILQNSVWKIILYYMLNQHHHQ